MNIRKRTVILTLCLGIPVGCQQPATVITTGAWALTGVVVVSGRVLNAAGVPVDSFRVSGSVAPGSGALYNQGVTTVTGQDGRYTLRIERSGGGPPLVPDSVLLGLGAQSLKPSDHNVDGSSRVGRREVWITFGTLTLPPAVFAVDFVVPVVR